MALSALFAATFAQTASMVSDQGIPLLLPLIKHDLALSLPVAAFVVTSAGLGRLLTALPVGQLVDRVGSRAVLTGTCITLALCLALAAAAHSVPLLLIALVAGGAATAGTTSGGAALVAQAFRARRGLAMGIRQSGVPLGGLVGAFLLPWVALASSWHWAIAVSAVIAASGGVVAFLMISGAAEQMPRVSRLSLASVLQPLRSGPLLALFIWGGFLVMGQYAFISLVPIQEGSLRLGVLMVAAGQVGGIVGRPGWGLISDLIGGRRRLCMVLISILAVAGCLAVGVLRPSAGPIVLAVAAFAFGLSVIGWQGLWATAITEVGGAGRAGSALGFGQLFIQVGILVGPVFVALVAGTPGGFRLAWIALALLVIAGSAPLLLVRRWPAEGGFATGP